MKLFVFDLDGTLLDSKGNVTKETKDAIKVIHDRGDKAAIATGRPHFMCLNIAKEVKIDYIIACNGSHAIEVKGNNKVVAETFISKDLIDRLLVFAKKNELVVSHYLDESIITYDYEDQKNLKKFQEIQNYIKSYIGKEFIKWIKYYSKKTIDSELNKKIRNKSHKLTMSGSFNSKKNADVFEALLKEFKGELSMFLSRSGDFEINPKGITKFVESSILKEEVKADELYTFGDDFNDYENIKNADVGVAMGNARNEIKEIADMITDTNDNNGISKAIHLIYQDL